MFWLSFEVFVVELIIVDFIKLILFIIFSTIVSCKYLYSKFKGHSNGSKSDLNINELYMTKHKFTISLKWFMLNWSNINALHRVHLVVWISLNIYLYLNLI